MTRQVKRIVVLTVSANERLPKWYQRLWRSFLVEMMLESCLDKPKLADFSR